MIKTILISVLNAIFLASASVTEAQQPTKIAKIGELRNRPQVRTRSENIALETRYHENKSERFPALAEELVRLKVDVLLGSSTNELIAFKNATKTIPIVFYTFIDPVAAGLVHG